MRKTFLFAIAVLLLSMTTVAWGQNYIAAQRLTIKSETLGEGTSIDASQRHATVAA